MIVQRIRKMDDNELNYTNIYLSFVKLLGNLSENNLKNINDVYNSILKQASDYEVNKDLTLISEEEFNIVFDKVSIINEEILWTDEGHISDAVENQLIHLDVLRKKQMEHKGGKNNGRQVGW